MKKVVECSEEHSVYLKKRKRRTVLVHVVRIAVLVLALSIWELFARVGIIDSFISSYPSEIARTTVRLFQNDNLFYHIGVTLKETVLGFIISVFFGYAIALLLWAFPFAEQVSEPYVVVLNSLPKIALGPIIIIWFGVGEKAIVAMAVFISIIVCLLTMLAAFKETDAEKIKLMKSFGATKTQIMFKLVIPGSMGTFAEMLKIALGMSWIGSIMGEYLVSTAGLGYLIVYGSQVFRLDLVMAATFVLLVLSAGMYAVIAQIEKRFLTVKA